MSLQKLSSVIRTAPKSAHAASDVTAAAAAAADLCRPSLRDCRPNTTTATTIANTRNYSDIYTVSPRPQLRTHGGLVDASLLVPFRPPKGPLTAYY